MTQDDRISSNPDILASAKALRRAARQALELGKRTGTPVYVLRNGQIVDLVHGKPWPHQICDRAAGTGAEQDRTQTPGLKSRPKPLL